MKERIKKIGKDLSFQNLKNSIPKTIFTIILGCLKVIFHFPSDYIGEVILSQTMAILFRFEVNV